MGDELLELVALAYEAGADAERWPRFLEQFSDALGDRTAAFQIEDVANGAGRMAITHRVDPASERAYAEHYAALNPWTARGASSLEPGRVLVGEMALPRRALHRTEFHADFLRPQDVEHSLAAVVDRTRDTAAFISVQRSARMGEFDRDDLALVERLAPHLQRALAIHHRLGAHRAAHEAVADTADRLPWAILLLDRARGVVFANGVARAFDRRLTARVLACAERGGGPLARRDGRPLHVTVAPLRARRELLGLEGPTTAVFVVDPDRQRLPPEDLLRAQFALTRAEARLACALARGDSLRDIADATGTSIATQRTHLKRVLAKTQTRRQAELIRLVLLMTPPYGQGSDITP